MMTSIREDKWPYTLWLFTILDLLLNEMKSVSNIQYKDMTRARTQIRGFQTQSDHADYPQLTHRFVKSTDGVDVNRHDS